MKLTDLNTLPELSTGFEPVRQVAYIVPDIDKAIAHWKSLGVPVFLVTRDANPLQNAFYRGKKSGKTPVNIAFGYLGDMQIELIEALHETPSIYTEALKRQIAGVHHYAICVEDFAKEYNHALNNGYEAVVDSGVDGLARMSYVENPKTGIILEMIEWNTLTRPYFEAIRDMWDKAAAAGQDREFDLVSLTPKSEIIRSLGKFLIKKVTGQIKPTRISG